MYLARLLNQGKLSCQGPHVSFLLTGVTQASRGLYAGFTRALRRLHASLTQVVIKIEPSALILWGLKEIFVYGTWRHTTRRVFF